MLVESMLVELDEWVLERIETFSHLTQRWVGIRATHWAQALLLAAMGFFITCHHFFGRGWIGIALYVLLLTHFAIRFWLVLKKEPPVEDEERAADPRRAGNGMRSFGLLLSVLFIAIDLRDRDLWFQCSCLAYYFEVVDELPKRPSRLREWVRSWGAGQAPQAVPAE